MDTSTIVTALGSSATGAALSAYLAKLFFDRLVRKQDEHEKKFEYLIDRFSQAISDLKTKLAVLEVAVADAKNIRTDMKEVEKRLAVSENKTTKAHDRIDRVKEGIANLHSDIEKLNSAM